MNNNDKKLYHCPTCKCNNSSYEFFNKVYEDSVSDYPAPINELPGRKVYIDLDQISDTERFELLKRLGPRHDAITMEDDD